MDVPDRVGRYRIIDFLGCGGFADVYLAHDDELDAPVAIKILSDKWHENFDVRLRFLDEARLLRKIDSDRVVRVYDIGELPGERPYFVMTFADRGTLAERLSSGPVSWQEGVTIAIDICEGLHELHERGVLHRDLKPSNVLFSDRNGDEKVLLGDLGLAKRLADASMITFACGTPGYMAPEQGPHGGPLGKHTDVYGAGAVLYRSITGRHVGTGADPGFPDDVPGELRQVIGRALQTDPDRRYPDIGALLTELRAIRLDSENTDTRPQRTKSHRRTRRALVAAAAAVTVAGASVAVVLARSPSAVELEDDSGAIQVSVPRDWAVQVAGTTWNPQVIGVEGSAQPSLLAAVSATRFTDMADDQPGVFIGLLPPQTRITANDFRFHLTHRACRADDPPAVAAALASTRHRCADVLVDDVLLAHGGRQAWLQVKQHVGQTPLTGEIAGSLQVAGNSR
ncbi:serine/threonine protein kinase [Amycolatopsis mediterranei S699]|uniref:non-specific serine/threonine protein kinase n=2 Tax=Amycolatopsis mediterranei TaxID=33910 RepID=A0A0H3DGN1_AMYMU|nr:serine/threonine-protein kinase [Amycolatopsis mediterranei]ADJ49866.1 serine/threonine protein kinase [Amycolatopsis mediterranei U32]AEK46856.1 serine/threonine protein kinase [Amycolatopsis mediterranei S699]AFO81574.1 serine/threonine protein kinase [Amycolatopsis mediterranei S699]AGT88703.1 serine/threonine protein kinase [Amycolatopsis mediterranei RB]KDO07884.1 serine/threonine protein kinase [Amycolatopsis mediterranei]